MGLAVVSRRLKYYVRARNWWWHFGFVQLAWYYRHNRAWLKWTCSDCRYGDRFVREHRWDTETNGWVPR